MKKAVPVLAGLLALAGSLSAGRFELGLNGGFFSKKGASGLCVGATAGLTGLGTFSLEAGYSSYPSSGQSGTSLSEFGLSVLIGPKLKETQKPSPFLLFGVSWFWASTSLEAGLEDIQFAIGGGVKWPVSRRTVLRFDGRYYLSMIGEDEYPAVENLWRLTVGVSFRL